MSANRWYISDVVKNVDDKIGRNLDHIGVFIQGEIVKSFGSGGAPGSGGTKGKIHSSPGEPPFVQTGTLRRSITFKRDGNSLLVGSSLQPQGGSKYSYAWLLEMGSPLGQLAARPYLRPAVNNNKNIIKKMLAGKQ